MIMDICTIMDCKNKQFALSTKKYCLKHSKELEFTSLDESIKKMNHLGCQNICSKLNSKDFDDEKDSPIFMIHCPICRKEFSFNDLYDEKKIYLDEEDFLTCICCSSKMLVHQNM